MARIFGDPFDTLFRLQRALDASLGSGWLTGGPSGGGTYPPLNIFRQGDDFVVIAELPGLRREDVDVEVKDNRIRLAGRKTIEYGKEASVHRRERLIGSFDRTIAIPAEIDADRAKAEYRNGILALLLPRAERDKPKSIAVH